MEMRFGPFHCCFPQLYQQTKDSSNEAFTRTGWARAEHISERPYSIYYRNGAKVVKDVGHLGHLQLARRAPARPGVSAARRLEIGFLVGQPILAAAGF
jgi:hypothetical protein